VEISDRFVALENLDECLDINNAWESIKENLGYHRQTKLQWLQNPSQSNEDDLQSLRHETSRTFRNMEREYLKDKINDLETNNKNKNIRDLYRGINEFKKRYETIIYKG
jgi:hypothetical protein